MTTLYTGEQKDGRPQGYGVKEWENGNKYEGPFVDGAAQGEGRHSWAVDSNRVEGIKAGDVYVGAFFGNHIHGHGKRYTADGKVFAEVWEKSARLSSDEIPAEPLPPAPPRPARPPPTPKHASKPDVGAAAPDGGEEGKKREFKGYYDEWGRKAKEMVNDELDAQEEAERVAAEEAAQRPRSEAEARDRAKFEALKQAKKDWEGRRAREQSLIFELVGIPDGADDASADREPDPDKGTPKRKGAKAGSDVELTVDMTGGMPVLEVKHLARCRVVLPPMLRGSRSSLIKVTLSGCSDCVVVVACPLMASLELVHCKNCQVDIPTLSTAMIVRTVQIDLCEAVALSYRKAGPAAGQVDFSLNAENKSPPFKCYHAGVSGLKVQVTDVDTHPTINYFDLMNDFFLNKDVDDQGTPAVEVQFVTQMGQDGRLHTDKVIRVGEHPTTQRELDEAQANIPEGLRAKVSSKLDQAEQDKNGGNEAFKALEYAQAGIYYTKAINSLLELPSSPPPDLLHVCFSNRAACNLKLGQPDKALADAKECVKLAPAYVKGLFRAGISLHALERYEEAGPYFVKALEKEPKNKAAVEALRFCRVKVAQQRQREQERNGQ